MDDDMLASLVTRDLRRNLEDRAPDVRDVYGFCLWADNIEGDMLASLATEEWFESQLRISRFAGATDEELADLRGPRWDVGSWHRFPDDDFLSDETLEALASLQSHLTDDSISDEDREAASARWRELAVTALQKAAPLEVLPRTADAIAFVLCPDIFTEEQVELMSRTVPPDRMPPWSGE